MSLGLADHLSRGVLPSVVRPVSVIVKPRKGRPRAGIGSKFYENISIHIYIYVCIEYTSTFIISNELINGDTH